MAKAIRSYPESQRNQVIHRRLKDNAGGLGTLSAQAAARARSVAKKSGDKQIRDRLISQGLIKTVRSLPIVEAIEVIHEAIITEDPSLYPENIESIRQ